MHATQRNGLQVALQADKKLAPVGLDDTGARILDVLKLAFREIEHSRSLGHELSPSATAASSHTDDASAPVPETNRTPEAAAEAEEAAAVPAVNDEERSAQVRAREAELERAIQEGSRTVAPSTEITLGMFYKGTLDGEAVISKTCANPELWMRFGGQLDPWVCNVIELSVIAGPPHRYCLSTLPEPFTWLCNLRTLHLVHHQLPTLPAYISRLAPTLQELVISHCSLGCTCTRRTTTTPSMRAPMLACRVP